MPNKMNSQACSKVHNRRVGFTLAEILVALGILAIGMSMVAAIFPAAMEFNRASTNKTLGAIICENAMGVSELALTAEVVNASGATLLTVFADDANVNYVTKEQQRYPTESDDPTKTGFAMMVRKIPATNNIYQLVTVAYRKTDKNNTVALLPVTCSVGSGANANNITSASGAKLKIGSPLINRTTGEFAFIDSINATGTTGTLDIDPATSKRDMATGGSYYILVERGVDTANLRRSPAIEAMSKVTGLKHDLNPDP